MGKRKKAIDREIRMNGDLPGLTYISGPSASAVGEKFLFKTPDGLVHTPDEFHRTYKDHPDYCAECGLSPQWETFECEICGKRYCTACAGSNTICHICQEEMCEMCPENGKRLCDDECWKDSPDVED